MDNDQLKDSLEKWMMAMELRLEQKLALRLDKLETRILDRIEAMEKRVSRQGGLVQGGSRQVARLVDWSEDTDTELLRHSSRISDLEKRLSKLDGAA